MNLNITKVKIAVMIPAASLETIRNSLFETKIGLKGNYTCCSTALKCIGTSKPNELAHPYIGESNKLEIVDEVKLEVICYIENVKEVLNKIHEIHPYEEPAIDIIPLIDEEYFK